jgi:DNA-binding transcriptional ArsR family regulator
MVLETMRPKDADIKRLEKIAKAFANRRRLLIVAYLKSVGKAPVWRIAGEIGLSLKATSRHLVILERVEILEKRQFRLEVFYRLASDQSRPVSEFIARL